MKLRIAKKIIRNNANNWEVPYYTQQQIDKAKKVLQKHCCLKPLFYWNLINNIPSSFIDEAKWKEIYGKMINQICVGLGVAKRIFQGNEEESLLSSQMRMAEERDKQRRDQYGVPVMQPILKALQDLKDIEKANAEAFWKGAMPPEQ